MCTVWNIAVILAYIYGTALATLPLSALPPAPLDGAPEYGGMPIHITGRYPTDIQKHAISPKAGPGNGNIMLDSMLEAFDDLPASLHW